MSICYGCFSEKNNASICPHCGYEEKSDKGNLILPAGTLLQDRYIVGRVLGNPGGFGITYLGFNKALQKKVAIKEYLPRDIVGRGTDRLTVSAYSREDNEAFCYGMEQFLREARILAKFDHANIVRVLDYFEDNHTAYLVMDFYQGVNLNEYISAKGGKLSWQAVANIMMPILDGLREVHKQGILHRDVKPQNIYLTKNDRPILLDFGNARQALGEKSSSLSVIMTPGFAPPEQYSRKGHQGAWTDIYGSAATMYYMLTGTMPEDALERLNGAQLISLENCNCNISPGVARAVMSGLALQPEQRPQTIADFQSLITGSTIPCMTGNIGRTVIMQQVNSGIGVPEFKPAVNPTGASRSKMPTWGWLALGVAVLVIIALVWQGPLRQQTQTVAPATQVATHNTDAQNPSQTKSVESDQKSLPAAGYKHYTNGRYGYSARYPADFIMGAQSKNGAGVRLNAPDGTATLDMYGVNNTMHTTARSEYEKLLAKKSSKLGYNTCGETWFVVTWEENGRLFYYKEFVDKGSINVFAINFAKEQKNYYDNVVTNIEANFKAGNLLIAH